MKSELQLKEEIKGKIISILVKHGIKRSHCDLWMNLIITKEIEEKVILFLKECGAKKISIFGSYVRGEATPDSDLDIIVDFEEGISLLDIVGFEMDLSEQLGVKVELLTEKSISPYIIEDVLAEAKVIYSWSRKILFI